MSTIPETIHTLEQFNKWRRGNKKTTAPDPFEVGVAIGDAVRLLRELFAMTARAEKAEAELAKRDSEYLRGTAMVAESASVWQARAEKAEAALATERKKVVDEITEKNASEIAKVNAHIADMTARAEKAEAELAHARVMVRVLREALESLRDEQNGAPLCTREEQWKQAMDGADAALAAMKEEASK